MLEVDNERKDRGGKEQKEGTEEIDRTQIDRMLGDMKI